MTNYYNTGQFAKMANTTERTIRYYDKVGLLKPTFVASNGYRKYSDQDLLKLQKILSLRNLGFSIEEIFPMIANDNENNFKDSLQLQIDLVNKKIQYFQSLKESLISTSKLANKGNIEWNKIKELIQLSNKEENIIEQYKNASNLNIRIHLHDTYSYNKQGWFNWLYSQIDFSSVYRLLEVGCGNGKLWENCNLNLRNREIFLSDISEGMVDEVKNKLGDDFNYMVIDCEHIPFKKGYYDVVIANHTLFYLKDLDKGLSEINRVLRRDGVLYCSTYGSNHMKEMRELVEEFDSRIRLSDGHLFDSFGLENGKEKLSNYFREIQRVDYNDYLLIDDAQPLLEYILSCHGNQNEIIGNRRTEFKKFLEDKIKKEGSIKITKEAGVFICVK